MPQKTIFTLLILLSATIASGQVSDTTFHANGKIQEVVIHLSNNTDKHLSFNDKGKLVKIFHRGYFNACETAVGTDTTFYPSGKIQETIFYDNKKSKTEEGCHSNWTTEVKTFYYPTGKIRLKSKLKYSYEGEVCPCGTWKYYNTKGILIKRKKFGDCYNQQIDCGN